VPELWARDGQRLREPAGVKGFRIHWIYKEPGNPNKVVTGLFTFLDTLLCRGWPSGLPPLFDMRTKPSTPNGGVANDEW